MGIHEGDTTFQENLIRIRDDLALDRMRSVLWHEVLHAVWEAADLPHGWRMPPLALTFSDFDEPIIEALCGRTLEVWRLNPAMRRFLLRGTR